MKSSRIFNVLVAVALLVSANLARAAPTPVIQVNGQGGWSCGTGTGGFEPSNCEPEFIEPSAIHFTYKLNGADTDPDPAYGLFRNVITEFTMVVEQLTRPALEFSLANSDSEIHLDGSSSFMNIVVWLREKNNAIPVSLASFGFYVQSFIDPNATPDVDNFWSLSPVAFAANVGNVGETDYMYAYTVSQEMLEVPLPGTLWLLVAGIMALPGLRRRSRSGQLRGL